MEKIIYHMGTTEGSEHRDETAPYFVTTLNHDLVDRILSWMDKFDGVLSGAEKVVLCESSTQFFEERPYPKKARSEFEGDPEHPEHDAGQSVRGLDEDEESDEEDDDDEGSMFSSSYDEKLEANPVNGPELNISSSHVYWEARVAWTDVVVQSQELSKADLLRLLTELE